MANNVVNIVNTVIIEAHIVSNEHIVAALAHKVNKVLTVITVARKANTVANNSVKVHLEQNIHPPHLNKPRQHNTCKGHRKPPHFGKSSPGLRLFFKK